jgi:hypothetical protein
MPVVIEVHYSDGSFDSKKVWIEKQTESFLFPNKGKKQLAYVLFDPNRQILKNLTFNRTFEQLKAQALQAPNMIDRYDAILEMRKLPIAMKRETLTKAYEHEKYYLARSEVISQLAPDSTTLSQQLLKKAIYDKDARVRHQLLRSISTVPGWLRLDYEKLLMDSSYQNVELALRNLCRSFPVYIPEYLVRTKDETGWKGRNIRMAWLTIALEIGLTQHLPELIGYTSGSYDFETRTNALQALCSLGYLDAMMLENLFNACFYWNYKLANEARAVLKRNYSNDKFRPIIKSYYNNHHWDEGQKTILADIFKE